MPPSDIHLRNRDPSPWVIRFAPAPKSGATALDLACGGGRHARWLLERGYDVTCVDVDTLYIGDLADRAEVIGANLEDGSPWPLTARLFDLVVVTNYLYRPLFAAIAASVAPGGMLIYETFMAGHERHARPRNPDHLLRASELLGAFPNLEVVAFEQGLIEEPGPKVVQRIACANGSGPAILTSA